MDTKKPTTTTSSELEQPVGVVHSPRSWLKVLLCSLLGVTLVGSLILVGLAIDPQKLMIANLLSASKKTVPNISGQTPTLSPTKNWKTYTDPNSIFTLRYPPHFYETKSIDRDPIIYRGWKSAGALTSVTPYNNGLGKEDDISIEMYIRPKRLGESLEQFVERAILTFYREQTDISMPTSPPSKIAPEARKGITMDGRQAIWLEGSFDPGVEHIYVFVPYKESALIFMEIFDGTAGRENRNIIQYEKNKALVEQILSTFNFLDQEGQPNLGWKTLNIPESGYEIKYPENNWKCDKNSYPSLNGNVAEIRPGEPCDCGFYITTIPNSQNLSPLGFWKMKESAVEGVDNVHCDGDFCYVEARSGAEKYTNKYQIEKVVVGGKEGIRIKVKEEFFSVARKDDGIYVRSKDKKMLRIDVCLDDTNQKILNTLRFLD